MVVVVIPKLTILNGGAMPPELQGQINQNAWVALCSACKSIDEVGNCLACGLESSVCFFTGCFCIFCCHPMVVDFLNQDRVRHWCLKLNDEYYQGRQVFVPGPNQSVVVNTENTIPSEVNIVPIPSQGTGHVVEREVVMGTMTVIVPHGAHPGSVIDVVTPAGTTIHATVPMDVTEGMQFKVEYPMREVDIVDIPAARSNELARNDYQPINVVDPVASVPPPPPHPVVGVLTSHNTGDMAPPSSSAHVTVPVMQPVEKDLHMKRMDVTVPIGYKPGTVMDVVLPSGKVVRTAVPTDAKEGSTFQMQYPEEEIDAIAPKVADAV